VTGTILPPIAFIGAAGSGKTTCAELLIKQYGYERLSFAEPLKIGCGTRTDRGLLQTVGQGVRDLFPDFWVNLAIHEFEQRNASFSTQFVNDDCRYPNEADALLCEGFVFVRVVAPKRLRIDRLRQNGKLQDEAQLDHISETALDDFRHDYRIVNDGWPDSLPRELEHILNRERS
jgi:hypothetical protein